MTDRSEQAFLETLARKPPAAYILGDATAHLLGFVRSLGRRGIPVAALTRAPGDRLWSRYGQLNRVVEDDASLLAFLERVGAQSAQRGVLMPTGDGDVLFLLRHRAELERYFRFSLPDADLLERLANKRFQYEHAAGLGIPVPRTCWPATGDDLRRIAESFSYPCVVKPAYSHLWNRHRRHVSVRKWAKAAHAETPEELVAFYEQMSECGVDLVIQERIEGEENRLFSCYAYLDEDSEPVGTFALQKRRQWPPIYGSGSYSVSCHQDEVVALTLRLLKGLGYRGFANVEFKRDAKDEQFKLIELNCRSGNRVGLAVDSGVDLPYLAYCDLIGEPIARVASYETGVTGIDLVADFAALPHYRRTQGLSLWEWTRSAWEARSHAYLSYDDPWPFVAQVSRSARGALTTWIGRDG